MEYELLVAREKYDEMQLVAAQTQKRLEKFTSSYPENVNDAIQEESALNKKSMLIHQTLSNQDNLDNQPPHSSITRLNKIRKAFSETLSERINQTKKALEDMGVSAFDQQERELETLKRKLEVTQASMEARMQESRDELARVLHPSEKSLSSKSRNDYRLLGAQRLQRIVNEIHQPLQYHAPKTIEYSLPDPPSLELTEYSDRSMRQRSEAHQHSEQYRAWQRARAKIQAKPPTSEARSFSKVVHEAQLSMHMFQQTLAGIQQVKQ